jgi:hypothetical protein
MNDRGVKYVPEQNVGSITLLGTSGIIGVSYERMFHNRLSLEVGIGILGYGIGLSVYPLQKTLYKELNWFTGFRFTYMGMIDAESRGISYIPFGATWFGPSGITIAVDLGPGLHTYRFVGETPANGQPPEKPRRKYPYSEINIWGSLKVGMRF